MARLIRAALSKNIETADLSRYANALAILGRLIEGGELKLLADRLDALESAAR